MAEVGVGGWEGRSVFLSLSVCFKAMCIPTASVWVARGIATKKLLACGRASKGVHIACPRKTHRGQQQALVKPNKKHFNPTRLAQSIRQI